jgi:hypothetical protein
VRLRPTFLHTTRALPGHAPAVTQPFRLRRGFGGTVALAEAGQGCLARRAGARSPLSDSSAPRDGGHSATAVLPSVYRRVLDEQIDERPDEIGLGEILRHHGAPAAVKAA